MTLEEIRMMKDKGKLKDMKPDAQDYDLPNEFWDKAEFKGRHK